MSATDRHHTSAVSGSANSGGSGAEPSEASPYLLPEAELDARPPVPRFDAVPARENVKLETRGITSQRGQTELWRVQTHFKETIVSKLLSIGRREEAHKLGNCHTQISIASCDNCGLRRKFWNRCENLYCPECQPRLSAERREGVEWWCNLARQPKHIVLTCRNTETLTEQHIRDFKAAFKSLRRSTFAKNWEGGFYSLEVTNEGRGWHLHLHAIIEARWIDSGKLAIEWAKRVGQHFAIVKVLDVREKSYLKEVTKYAVKGSDMASWSAPDIAAFIDAFGNTRTFGVFGNLFGKRKEWKEHLKGINSERGTCECGCNKWTVRDENEQDWHDIQTQQPDSPRPPPTEDLRQRDFAFRLEPFRLMPV